MYLFPIISVVNKKIQKSEATLQQLNECDECRFVFHVVCCGADIWALEQVVLRRCVYVLSSSSVNVSERGGCCYNFNLLFFFTSTYNNAAQMIIHINLEDCT